MRLIYRQDFKNSHVVNAIHAVVTSMVTVYVCVTQFRSSVSVNAFVVPNPTLLSSSSSSLTTSSSQPSSCCWRRTHHHHPSLSLHHVPQRLRLHAARPTTASILTHLPNPLQKLPWNVAKERQREARRLKTERAKLHRELGIAEDATYEEIVAATDALLARAEASGEPNRLKRKIQIEVTKDKILQIRLNERLAGLAAAQSKEARAQSSYELSSDDDDEETFKAKSAVQSWNAPRWTQGLVVKPDEARIKSQVKLWGGITLLGILFPPSLVYAGRFTWIVCVAQLMYRGMSREDIERGGIGSFNFNSNSAAGSGGGGHRKVAFVLSLCIWMTGSILIYSLLPKWAQGHRWTRSVTFALQNLIFAIATSYLQPYKG